VLRALLTAGIAQSALVGQQCTVQEEQRWWTVTGHFSLGELKVSLTMPAVVRRATTVYLEVPHNDAGRFENFFLDADGERVAITNGAALHLVPVSSRRFVFSFRSNDSRSLCTWSPSLRRQSPIGQSSEHADGFSRSDIYRFRKTGEPISLNIGGDLANGPAAFQIGGIPAMVLCWNPVQVVLRDPAPEPGSRLVRSQRYSITLRFIDIESQLSKPSYKGVANFTVRVPKLNLWGRHLWPTHPRALPDATAPYLALANFNPDNMKLLCGKDRALRPGADFPQFREVRITQDMIRDGGVSISCKVYADTPDMRNLEVDVFEVPVGSLSRSLFPF